MLVIPGEVRYLLSRLEQKGYEEMCIRDREYIVERAYTQEELSQWLEQAGFELLAVYGEDSLDPPAPDCQRWIFAARKK